MFRKKKYKLRLTTFFLFIFLFVINTGCYNNKKKSNENNASKDLPQLKEEGRIKVVTLYSSTSYFQYRMEPMGYEYDLISDFARSQGLKLEIKVAENSGRLIEMLESGEADVVAYPLQITNERKQRVLFCGEETHSTQVLIQRANRGDKILKDVTDLIGKEVHVKSHTRYAERLKSLNEELGGGIQITDVEKDTITSEDLIESVSRGGIAYTVSDDKTARLNKTYFQNINVNLPISFMQRSSWVVRKSSPELAKAIDEWASGNTSQQRIRAITKRYFELSKQPFESTIPEVIDGRISPYDDLFKTHAPTLEWDWQLIASISYQESHFNPSVVSWAGAQGLMGVMPNTARAFDVDPSQLNDPETGILTGIACLRRFRNGFSEIEDPLEKMKFTLASYNAGIGHIYDAQRLAEKYGKDPKKWDENVAEFVRLKNDPEYYNDPVCKHGYLRGSETYKYVFEVLQRYAYYKKNT